MEEIIAREATIIKITDAYENQNQNDNNNSNDNLFFIPKNECFSEVLTIITLQIMSLILSIERNSNVDYPRHLAKTVTV
jgi:glucosamine 6-phosphate synthetase-like amidotransferase/phosphosugar isomerase protein